MLVTFLRTGPRRYGVKIAREAGPNLVMDPAPGYDPDLPHDLVHMVVEAILGLRGGVFGQIAAGGNAGSFRVDPQEGAGNARAHQRMVRKQGAKGQKLVTAQGRDGELSELAAFLFDVGWRSSTGAVANADPAARQAVTAEIARIRASLSDTERARFDRAETDIFHAFSRCACIWRALPVGGALTLAWPTLKQA